MKIYAIEESTGDTTLHLDAFTAELKAMLKEISSRHNISIASSLAAIDGLVAGQNGIMYLVIWRVGDWETKAERK